MSNNPHGTLFIADRQTAGKGRLGRTWESEKSSGIYMSLLLKPQITPENAAQITLIAGMAVCRALGNVSKIKWPNDVVIGTKKVSGILTELSSGCVICGIGINVNTKEFSAELCEKATSLFIETNKKQSIEKITADVINEFMPLYNKFIKDGFSSLCAEYKSLCVNLGKEVSVIQNNTELRGVASDISPDGGLVVKTDTGEVLITSGEVSVRGIYGYI